MKDLFSTQAKQYAAFRPVYPEALYTFILQHVKEKGAAWDCATGNGQVAQVLATHFERVCATDISQQQLDHAAPAHNIVYAISAAEQTTFAPHQFDLITVGQALHWFDLDRFYAEANRVGKPGALLAIWGYALLYIAPGIDEAITDFYENTVGPYWDHARRLVENQYATLPFPFERIAAPPLNIEVTWTLEHLSGYFSSWSATQKFIKDKGYDPVPAFIERLAPLWGQGEHLVKFPVFMLAGKISNAGARA
ncbi:class I SAM-dependent methyltransferase [Chryseolinea lacunae]|uniref:Class I SAM-dependent methyltransferase n=1 Tax=Chryseolinea lacunae TaxID=2801331 RepID=A0ABS1KPD9_9BACT|nr:class I SAM-dependent methyltransferase [Chryseolinea lacunae]MBL0741188.1 class I SAM-dependent methyltransferase [Chryseolinea lacunae]